MTTSGKADGNEKAVTGRNPTGAGTLCGRCDFLNPLGLEDCERCGVPLFVECKSCGEVVQRIYTRCTKCHRRLHGGLKSKSVRAKERQKGRSRGSRASRRFIWILAILAALFAAAGMILKYYKMK